MKGNILKIEGLNKDWNDKNNVMLHAVFQILCDFIEKEHPEKITDFNYDKKHKDLWKEIQVLYKYWKTERLKEQKRIDKLTSIWAKKHKIKFVPSEVKFPNGKIRKCSELVTVVEAKKEWNILNKAEQKFNSREDEMLIKLMKIRKHLWS